MDAIARVVADAQPEPRDADELHDLLLGRVAMVTDERWAPWLTELVRVGRAAHVDSRSGPFAFAAEHATAIAVLYPGARVAPALGANPRGSAAAIARDEAVLAIVRGHSETLGPFTSSSLAGALELPEWEVASAIARLESDGVVLRGCFTPGAKVEEICDRRLLARIHKATLDRLRREIEPVSARDFLRFLFQRHHLDPRSRAGGRAGLRDAIGMLQGFEIAAAAWEPDVLSPRVAGYRPEWLDELCLAGEVAHCRLSPRAPSNDAGARGSTSRATPIAMTMRRDLGWLLRAVRGAVDPELPTTSPSIAVLDLLRRRGALFFDDLAVTTGLSAEALTLALWDVVGRGLVAPDGYRPLRDLMASARRRRQRPVHGRWAMVDGIARQPLAADELADRVAEQLLLRYGVVFRELTVRESFTVPWREVAHALRRREACGLVRGGRFVSGFVGEQYALPDAVEALRRVRREPRSDVVVRVSAVDPLNLVGILTPGSRIPARPASWLLFCDGGYISAEDARRPDPVSSLASRSLS